MGRGFEERAYDAACIAQGAAVWQLIVTKQTVSQEAIVKMAVELSYSRFDLADSIALSVLR